MQQAVAALAKDEQVICVALALYAHMIKGQPWTSATLEGPGDLKEVGKTFLKRSFAPGTEGHPYEKAARQVLELLLPEANVDLINVLRKHDDLQQASGYANRPDEFVDLVKILSVNLPLIMEVESDEDDRDASKATESGPVQYRLTHEYLVEPLRAWLHEKDGETLGGRAKLALRKRTGEWKGSNSDPAKRDNTYLPGLLEYGKIVFFAPRSEFRGDQRDLIGAAHRRYAKWGGVVGVVVVMIGLIVGLGVWNRAQSKAQSLTAAMRVSALLEAAPHGVPSAIENLGPFLDRALPALEQHFDEAIAKSDPQQGQKAVFKLRAAYALARYTDSRQDAQGLSRGTNRRGTFW